jgi:O-antigen/teichoic acid export membrane protein
MSINPSVSMAAKIREVGVHSVIYGFGSIAQSAVQFLLIPVLTASLATSEFGAYSLIQMASIIAGSVFYLGMTSALPRSYFDYSDGRERRSVFTTAFLLLLAGAVAQIAVGQVGGRWISRLLLQTDRYHAAVVWAFLGSALSFVNQFFFTYLRFLRRSVASIILSIIALVGSIGVSLYLLHLDRHDLTAPFRGIAYAQAAVSVAFVLVYGSRAFTMRLNRSEIAVLLKFGVPTVLTSIAVMAIEWADRILIERMVSIHDVGVYSVGYRLGSIVNTLVVIPFAQIWNPMMIEYRSHGNIAEFFSRIVSYYFLASSIILIGTCLFIRDALPFIARSPDYAAAAPVVLLVMTGYLVNGSANIVSAGLIYERRIFRLAAAYYAIAAAKIGLNLYLIPRFGITGAAVTSLLIYALIPIVLYWQAGRYFPIHFQRGRLLRIFLIIVFSLYFALVIDTHYPFPLLGKVALFLLLTVVMAVLCTDQTERRRALQLISRSGSRHT